jgi:hypothetical protein
VIRSVLSLDERTRVAIYHDTAPEHLKTAGQLEKVGKRPLNPAAPVAWLAMRFRDDIFSHIDTITGGRLYALARRGVTGGWRLARLAR